MEFSQIFIPTDYLTKLADLETFSMGLCYFIFALLFTKIKSKLVTIIKIALAVIFTLSVVSKLTGKTKSTFENAGFPPIFMYATALAEIILTVGLFTRYELLSTVGLLAIMGGAIFTLFRQRVKPAKYGIALIAVVLLITLLVLQISKASLLTGGIHP